MLLATLADLGSSIPYVIQKVGERGNINGDFVLFSKHYLDGKRRGVIKKMEIGVMSFMDYPLKPE